MAAHWCKVASNLDTHPKIRKAGRLGREVFLFALRRNAEPGNPIPGRIPCDELEPGYLCDMLQMPCDEAVTGVTSAVTAGLLVREGDCYLIAAWKEGWGKTKSAGADRTAKWRQNRQLQDVTSRGDGRDARDTGKRHGDSGDTDKIREEEKKNVPCQGDIALTTVLILRIIKNSPGCKLTKLSGPEKTKKLHKWADHIRLMREVDGHSEDEIKAVIDWSQSDPFWRKNILSTEKLREKWDQLVIGMGTKAPKPAALKAGDQPSLVFMVNGVEVSR